MQNSKNKSVRNYFDIISDWKRVYAYLSDNTSNYIQIFCEYILSGYLAAYYYQDNMLLRQTLNNIKVPPTLNTLVQFAKAYVDIFIQSENMSKPLSQQDYFSVMQVFETIMNRQKQFSNDAELLLDILNYDTYILTNYLFLKNDECLVLLLKSYLFNDIAHPYKDAFHNKEAFLENP